MSRQDRALRRWLSPKGLLLAGALYALASVLAQLLAGALGRPGDAALRASADLLVLLGLAFALLQTATRWDNRLVRYRWLSGVLGMAAIGLVRGIAGPAPAGAPLSVAVWAAAAALLLHCVGPYFTTALVARVVWASVAAQALAHLAWLADRPGLRPLTDGGELLALLCYGLGMLLARLSHLDQRAARHDRLQCWAAGAAVRPRVCFPYNAQIHQIWHSLPIAVALARRHPEIEVHVAGSRRNLAVARRLVRERAGDAPLRFDRLYHPLFVRLRHPSGAVGGKTLILWANRLYFSGFDAIVTPEHTSTHLRKFCPAHLQFIGTKHGAGDREAGFSPETALFDFLLLGGEKQAERLLELGYAAPGRYVTGIYAKLDWALQHEPKIRLFDNDRPTVLYNPHFDPSLSSWPLIGRRVLDHFARSTRYNLVFAPHIRLFDAPTRAKYAAFRDYCKLAHMRIDLGSERCVDMTYTLGADLYLGDVSSQVVEFLTRPRPCLFLNPRRLAWQDDPSFRFWHLGLVLEEVGELDAALERAVRIHPELARRQRDYLRDSLGLVEPGQSGARGADAIVAYLRQTGAGRLVDQETTGDR
ncbi:hypothetical protein ACFOJE_13915 [Azotobacter bryophylli]|uniref:Uncharacterized protein n=1 Tax=Azotobacter bryophylli TaxID=1986537 RepID=A0ABV7AX53_9GAMM